MWEQKQNVMTKQYLGITFKGVNCDVSKLRPTDLIYCIKVDHDKLHLSNKEVAKWVLSFTDIVTVFCEKYTLYTQLG